MTVKLVCLSLLLAFALAGCGATRDYARVGRNHEVEKYFRTDRLEPAFRYFYTGPGGEPIALLALDRRYTLMSVYWHEFTTGFDLKNWMRDIDRVWGHLDDIEYVTIIYKGHEILSRDNERIGMVYSRYDWIVAWWGEGENEIYVMPPEPGGNQRAPQLFRRWRDRDYQ